MAAVEEPLVTDGSTLSIRAASSDGPGSMSSADKSKLDRLHLGAAGQPEWTTGPAGLAASTFGTTYYELLWANRTGTSLTVSAYINGGRDGMSVDVVNTTTIALVRRALDGSGSDTAMGAYSNDAVALTAKGDTEIVLFPSTVTDGTGVFVKITKASSGTNIGPGTRVYLTF